MSGCFIPFYLPALVAQVDVCPTGGQEVLGLIATLAGNIIS